MCYSITQLKNIVQKELSNIEGSAHSYKHTERVFKIATHIAEQEKADLARATFENAINWCRNRAYINPFMFHTETAKKIADKRYTTMRLFVDSLEKELLM